MVSFYLLWNKTFQDVIIANTLGWAIGDCTYMKTLNPLWAERQTILRTSFIDFFPPLPLSAPPTMKYPKERKRRPLGGSHKLPDSMFWLLIMSLQNAWREQKGNQHTRDLRSLSLLLAQQKYKYYPSDQLTKQTKKKYKKRTHNNLRSP